MGEARARGNANEPPAGAATESVRPFGQFKRGFAAMLPLWAGAIPVGLAYGVAARGIGLSVVETQLMSLLVFSAAAQLSAVALLNDGAPVVVIVVTALMLNAQVLLLGLAVARVTRPRRLARLEGAFLLTDGAYAVAVAGGRLTLPGILGTGASMYLAWNAATALGAAVGQSLTDPSRFGVDLVAPLMFLAVLVPLLRSRPAVLTALAAGAITLTLVQVIPSGVPERERDGGMGVGADAAMTAVSVVLSMAVGLYALRLSGFLLAGVGLPQAWERALGYVPVATLTALVVAALAAKPVDAPVRIAAVAVGGLLAWKVRRPWMCILGGVGCFWLLQLV